MQHTPVLLKEVLAYLDPRPGTFVIDGTLDGGGHAREIILRLAPDGKFLGVDWDAELVRRFGTDATNVHVQTLSANYADLPHILRERGLPKAHGLLLDLGFSSEQLEESGKGFSFLREEPLLMTYSEERTPVRDLLRHLPQTELERIIREYGGERYAGRIAKGIVMAKRKHPITTSKQLADIVRESAPRGYERGRIHPATRTFQALRIHANDELDNVRRILGTLGDVVAPNGRVVIITFHSLEDRLVKEAFKAGAQAGQYELLTKKPVTASTGEMRKNPRSRSAKLRAIQLMKN